MIYHHQQQKHSLKMETKMNNSNPNENLPVQYISDDGDSDYDEELQNDDYQEE